MVGIENVKKEPSAIQTSNLSLLTIMIGLVLEYSGTNLGPI